MLEERTRVRRVAVRAYSYLRFVVRFERRTGGSDERRDGVAEPADLARDRPLDQ